MVRVLIVESDRELAKKMAINMFGQGYEVLLVHDVDAAMEKILDENFDLIFLDLELKDGSGIELVTKAKETNSSTCIVLMVPPDLIGILAEELERGVDDYLKKPVDFVELEMKTNQLLERRRLMCDSAYLRHTQDHIYRFQNIIGESPQIKKVISVVQKVAKSNAAVLVLGETGTGKELIASAIHFNSLRKKNNFVKVNCAALQENLLESELFGHEKGAFTGADKQRIGRFEQANFGTIFLDEIADMSSSTQAKVLRVLQEQEFERLGGTKTIKVDVRIIAATNKDLKEAIERRNFRDDLYYRLNVVTVSIPPLRERHEDIVPLAMFFLRKFCGEFTKDIRAFSDSALKLIHQYDWPGNIRELKNAVERSVLMTDSDVIRPDDLGLSPEEGMGEEKSPVRVMFPPGGINLENVERSLVLEALKKANWIQKDAAALLGISRRVMLYKIQKYGIKNPNWTKNR